LTGVLRKKLDRPGTSTKVLKISAREKIILDNPTIGLSLVARGS